jgi:Mg-chelatase subunit ChlD
MPGAYCAVRKSLLRFLKKFNRTKRNMFKGEKRRALVLTERSGRCFRAVEFRDGENTLAMLPTVISAVFSGDYDLAAHAFHIGRKDFRGWERRERQSLTLVLVVDVSRSTFPFVNVFAEILNSLTGYFRIHTDRVGLISLQGSQARIMNHPTNNYQVVARSLLQLRIKGETPLADGLLKALTMTRLERFRKPGSRNIAVLLSDCYPEPITGRFADIFQEPSYREALRAASLFPRNRVSLLIINPSFRHEYDSGFTPGERLAVLLSQHSRGQLVRLYRPSTSGPEETSRPTAEEIYRIISGIENIVQKRSPLEIQRIE